MLQNLAQVESLYALTDVRIYLDVLVFSHDFDGQRNAFQRDTKNLWHRERSHVFLLLPRVQFVAYTRLCAARSSSTLSGSRTGYPLLCQNRKPSVRVVVCFLDFPPINDVGHIINSDGRLLEPISGTDDLELWQTLASATLVVAMIFHFFDALKTARCSPLVRLAWRG